MRDPKIVFGRFKVLPRTDGRYIVFDPARPLGRGTVADFAVLELARAECKRVSDEATARGEPNEVERVGFKLDWGDPATWEVTANVPPRPLFPSLLEHAKASPHVHEEEHTSRGERRSELELELVDERDTPRVRAGSPRRSRGRAQA